MNFTPIYKITYFVLNPHIPKKHTYSIMRYSFIFLKERFKKPSLVFK
ncbi:hypothetical protein [Bacillus phage FI_KG-Lek]|nr:hypothetical protein [Bacillus phage FI_KG-Lek]